MNQTTHDSPAPRRPRASLDAAIEAMRQDGIARIPCFLSTEEIAVLQARSAELMEGPSIPFADYHAKYRNSDQFGLRVYSNPEWRIVNDLLGSHADLDRVFETVITNEAVRGVLLAVLGSGYKLWDANLRRHEPGSPGQDLHQDGLGGVGIAILVDDHPDPSGATVFLPRSHRLPIRYGDLGLPLRPRVLRPALVAAEGRPGDVVLWFTRTWHGRHAGPHARTSLLASVWGRGSHYQIHSPPAEVLARLPPEVRRVMDPQVGVRIEDGVAHVLGDGLVDPDPGLTFYAFSRQVPGPWSPWHLVRGFSSLRTRVIDTVGRERLRKLRARVGGLRT